MSYSNFCFENHKKFFGFLIQINIHLLQIRANVEDHGVEFQPLTAWFIDEENSVSYNLLGDFKPSSGDWIGLFHDGFITLDEYLVYEYISRGNSFYIIAL